MFHSAVMMFLFVDFKVVLCKVGWFLFLVSISGFSFWFLFLVSISGFSFWFLFLVSISGFYFWFLFLFLFLVSF